jgi:NADH dehydrogenase/NADH:ubiquinone oxidoreductase subunit G
MNDALDADLSAPSESEEVKLTEQNTPEGTAPDGLVEKEKQDEPVKTFTQAEVDAMVQKRLLKEERRVHRRVEQQLREQQQAATLQKEPDRAEFVNDEAYLKAQVEHLAEVRAAEKLAERERAQEAERRSESFIEKAEKASERYPDFQAVVGNPSLTINEGMAEFISESDQGADVAYFLGKNPAKAAEIARLSPIKAARELTRIESELAARPKATPSKAPEPINPVGQRGRASVSSLPSDDDDIDTWMRIEAARARR